MTAPEPWVFALGIAGAVALVVTPLAARASRQDGRSAVWGGSSAGLAAALVATAPLLAIGGAATPLVVGFVAALGLWGVGALVYRGQAPERVRSVSLLLAAVAVTISGLRLPVTGFAAGDVVVTIGVVYSAVWAWHSSRTRDGLLLGWTATLGATAGFLAGLDGQRAAAAVGAGLVGASLGFLAYWLPPTAARLRTGGGLLIGMLAVVLALDTRPALGTPQNAAIPLLLLALPLLDTGFVVAARFGGHQEDPQASGLVGRLRALGLPRAATTTLLIAFQLGLGVLAIFAGRNVLALGFAAAVATVALAGLWVAGLTDRLPGARGQWSRRAALLGTTAIAALAILAAPAVLALVRARDASATAVTSAEDGVTAAERGDTGRAAAAFKRAEALFAQASRQLSSPLVSGGLLVPVLAPNLSAARDLVSVGTDLARVGTNLATSADPQQLRIGHGTVPLAELTRLEPGLANALHTLTQASSRLRDLQRGFLVAPIDNAVTKLDRRVTKTIDETRIALEATRVLPAVFGGDGPRRYFLAVENNAEARATGGFIGNWGIITASNGKLTIGQFQRIAVLNPTAFETRTLHAPSDYRARYARFEPQQSWQNVDMSPDLPTVGPIIADLASQSGAAPVNGVVTIDPVGLADVMQLTGPVRVAGWPGPITAGNVVDVTLRQAYAAFGQNSAERDEFLGSVADAVWQALTIKADLGNTSHILKVLGLAAREKHLAVWTADPQAQRLVSDAHADAAVPRTHDDLSLVTTQNAGGNKLDVYLQRELHYVVHLTPSQDGRQAFAQAQLDVTLRNTAPRGGLPQEVGGPNIAGIAADVNRSFVTVYSPLRLLHATVDGAPIGLDILRELGYWTGASYLDVPPLGTGRLGVDAAGTLPLGTGGQYELQLVHQPLVGPDTAKVDVDVPPGWRLVAGQGLRPLPGGRSARFTGPVSQDLLLSARVERDPGSLWDRLQAGR